MSQEHTPNVLRASVIPVEAPSAPQVEAPVLSELEQRLQAVLTPPQEEVKVQSAPTPQVTSEPERVDETVTSTSYSDEEQAKFREMFQLQFGVAPEEFKTQVQTITQERQQAQQLNELRSLQTEWGVDQSEVGHRLNAISQKLATLPVETQKALDNPEGIRFLWSSIQAEVSSKQPPRFDKSSMPAASSQRPGTFTRAEINAMDNATYQRNIKAIEYAYSHGLIVN
jgi:uncharacterized protein with von Willebrand factor type A (vWA) domain